MTKLKNRRLKPEIGAFLLLAVQGLLSGCGQPSYEMLMKDGEAAAVKEDYVLAEKNFQAALKIALHLHGNDLRLGEACFRLANCYRAEGKADEASRLYHQALPAMEKSHGVDSLEVARIYHCLGTQEIEKQNNAQAVELLRRSSEIFKKISGDGEPEAGQILSELAGLDALDGKYTQAESEYKKAIAIGEENPDAGYADLCRLYHGLANALRMQDKEDAAAQADRHADEVQMGGIKEKVHSMPAL